MEMKHTFSLVLLFCAAVAVYPQNSELGFLARPTVSVPIGPELDNGTLFYSIGGGVNLEGLYTSPRLDFLAAGLLLDASVMPINGSAQSASFIALGPVLELQIRPLSRLALGVRGYGGLYMGIIDAGSIRDPFYGGGPFVSYRLNPSLSLGLDAEYRDYLTSGDSALTGLSFGLGVRYTLGGNGRGADLIVEPAIQPIFPLFFSYYDKNPAGTVRLGNHERGSLDEMEVSFFVKQFMDQPKLCARIDRLAGGEEIDIPVYALFAEDIFRVTEGTKVAGEIILDYSYIGRRMSETIPVTVAVNNRNAMTWDDDRKAAAFVTAKDPLVLSFAKNVAATVGQDRSTAINETFRTALGIFEALTVYGMGYVIDPATPYARLSESQEAVDYLQFPSQSIAYKAGDCDDLTILYASLLESVGIRTAFITAPGHIYMAFGLDMAPEQASRLFAEERELIYRDGETWIPVEITLVREGFLKAWQIGAKEWRETSNAGTARFYDVREAWKTYEPIGFAEGSAGIILPNETRLMESYRKAMITFINRQIEPQVSLLRGELAGASNTVGPRNRLGILYARFGVLDKAASEFEAILRTRNYVPAMVNLGNVYYLQERMQAAYDLYSRAAAAVPDNNMALLGLARASYALERYGETDAAMARLETAAPELAAAFAYPGSGSQQTGRASQAVKREISTWDEEE